MNIPEETNTVIDTEQEQPPKKGWKRELLEWVASILIAVVLALTIREFVFTLVQVQGESMEPTLHHSDRLYVNRFFYTPEKGDIIIFEPASAPGHPYIKRIIATEGDTVYIDYATGEVYVNDVVIEEPYIKEKTRLKGLYILQQEKLGYDREHPIVVRKDHYFVMGDNRNNSKDSRELGQIPKEDIMGGAVFRFWPLNSIGSVSEAENL